MFFHLFYFHLLTALSCIKFYCFFFFFFIYLLIYLFINSCVYLLFIHFSAILNPITSLISFNEVIIDLCHHIVIYSVLQFLSFSPIFMIIKSKEKNIIFSFPCLSLPFLYFLLYQFFFLISSWTLKDVRTSINLFVSTLKKRC